MSTRAGDGASGGPTGGRVLRRLTAVYGASPLHLLALVTSAAVAGYAAVRLLAGDTWGVVLWFAGAAVAHDLVLLPLYAVVDVGLVRTWRRTRRGAALPPVPWLDHVRLPAVVSGVLLLVWFPDVLRLSGGYEATTTLSSQRFLGHWLAITAGLFATSALVYALRLRRALRARSARSAR